MDEDERAPSPEETLLLIEQQRAAATKRFEPDPLLMYSSWGVAWLLGFGAFFLVYGFDGHGYAPLTWQVALAILMGGQFVALALLMYAVTRAGAHVRGETEERGWMLGTAWFIGMTGVGLVGSRFAAQIPEAEFSLLSTAFSMLVAGTLYIATGAMWRQWPLFMLGVWISVVNMVGVSLGTGWHPLLLAVFAGGGAIVTGVWMRWRR